MASGTWRTYVRRLSQDRCNLKQRRLYKNRMAREWMYFYLQTQGNFPQQKVAQPDLPAHSWPDLPSRLPFDSPHYASLESRILIVLEDQKLILKVGISGV